MELLDQIDGERGGPLRLRLRGEVIEIKPATDLNWKLVLGACSSIYAFGGLLWPAQIRVTYRQLIEARKAWMTVNGLPEGDQCRRLVYMCKRYWPGVEYDLRNQLGLSAAELWQSRHWREMLGYIDHLPTNSHMNRLLTLDEEYMEALERSPRRDTPMAGRPSMADWSLTNGLLAKLIDAVNRNTAVAISAANPKAPKPNMPPEPRPYTAAERVRYHVQQEAHEEMVAVLMRDRPGRTR